MDARDFFDESAKAAKRLGRRAVLLYGKDNDPPKGLSDDIVGFEYAPFSRVFPHAACVVHQGGVGTTGQVLRAGVPHLIMPYGHDQLDNAMRCRRIGVAEVIRRERYSADRASQLLTRILSDPEFSKNAAEKRDVIEKELGAMAACDEIESVLIR
jgi:UDP:flavonoid glycosyltransferase YjiC (YdhE family)